VEGVKNSSATRRYTWELSGHCDQIALCVSDGVRVYGFMIELAKEKPGLGLISMRRTARAVGVDSSFVE